MLPKYHIIIGALVSVLVYLTLNIGFYGAILLFLGSFLIDVDHYLNYAIRFKDISLYNARKYFFSYRGEWLKLSRMERDKFKRPLFIFHGIESWILIYALSYFNKAFLFILYGMMIHIILDYFELITVGEPLYPKMSQIYLYTKNKKRRDFWDYLQNQTKV